MFAIATIDSAGARSAIANTSFNGQRSEIKGDNPRHDNESDTQINRFGFSFLTRQPVYPFNIFYTTKFYFKIFSYDKFLSKLCFSFSWFVKSCRSHGLLKISHLVPVILRLWFHLYICNSFIFLFPKGLFGLRNSKKCNEIGMTNFFDQISQKHLVREMNLMESFEFHNLRKLNRKN